MNENENVSKKIIIKPTKGFMKLKNYIEEIIKSDSFQEYIKKLRIKYKIPPEGFKKMPKKFGLFDYPEEWHYYKERNIKVKLDKNINRFCISRNLRNITFKNTILIYLFYNLIIIKMYIGEDLCRLCDLVGDKILLGFYKPERAEIYQKLENCEDLEYPLAIKISPYASQRDIVDFIKNNFSDIYNIQNKYKNKDNKMGRIKIKNAKIQERIRFIYNNRNLPRRKIAELVNNKFKTDFGYEYIGKIISDEKKKRKEL